MSAAHDGGGVSCQAQGSLNPQDPPTPPRVALELCPVPGCRWLASQQGLADMPWPRPSAPGPGLLPPSPCSPEPSLLGRPQLWLPGQPACSGGPLLLLSCPLGLGQQLSSAAASICSDEEATAAGTPLCVASNGPMALSWSRPPHH